MRFFFDFVDGSYTSQDCDGHECESAEEARIQAMRVLPEVFMNEPQEDNNREVVCSVRGECGSVLYRASLTLKVQEMANS